MYVINNKFEIGEECFSVYRNSVSYECPICCGKGHFMHNNYEIRCKNCKGTGKLHNANQFVMDVCKVTVLRIIANISNGIVTIKYKVDVVPWEGLNAITVHVNNRSEGLLFKSYKEASEYCEKVNTGRMVGEF